MCLAIIYCSVCGFINFESDHGFLIKFFFYITKVSGKKCQEQKQLFTGNKKHFSSFFIKGFQLSETASGVRVGH